MIRFLFLAVLAAFTIVPADSAQAKKNNNSTSTSTSTSTTTTTSNTSNSGNRNRNQAVRAARRDANRDFNDAQQDFRQATRQYRQSQRLTDADETTPVPNSNNGFGAATAVTTNGVYDARPTNTRLGNSVNRVPAGSTVSINNDIRDEAADRYERAQDRYERAEDQYDDRIDRLDRYDRRYDRNLRSRVRIND